MCAYADVEDCVRDTPTIDVYPNGILLIEGPLEGPGKHFRLVLSVRESSAQAPVGPAEEGGGVYSFFR